MSNGNPVFTATTSDKEEGYLSQAAGDLILFHQTINDLQGELIYTPPIKVGTTWQGSQGEAEVVAQETVQHTRRNFSKLLPYQCECCFNVSVVDDNDYYSIWLAKNVGPVKLARIDASDGDVEATLILEKFNAR